MLQYLQGPEYMIHPGQQLVPLFPVEVFALADAVTFFLPVVASVSLNMMALCLVSEH